VIDHVTMMCRQVSKSTASAGGISEQLMRLCVLSLVGLNKICCNFVTGGKKAARSRWLLNKPLECAITAMRSCNYAGSTVMV
jgi:hypothetical protein